VLSDQHHRNGNHHFICHRVEERAEASALVPATRQITIKPVGDGGHEENECTREWRPDERQIKRHYKERDKNDTEKREQRRNI
jgi:hypothetical protein